jgi:hypothetical protein
MREVDPRRSYSRRFVLKAAPAAAAVGAAGLAAADAWAEGGALTPATMKTLMKVARDIYPHDALGDQYYIAAVTPWNDKAAADPKVKALIEGGIAQLDAAAMAAHALPYARVGWEEERVALLRGIEKGDFFRALRADLVVSLYNQHDLWPKFGYEGASFDKGGYIERGFNDIDWLSKA